MWDTAGAGILWVLLQFVPIVSFTLLQIWGRSFFPQKSIWLDSMFSEVSCLCACFTSFSKKHWKYTLVQCRCQPCYTTRLSNQLHTELIAVESSLRTFRWNWRLWRLERPKICQAQRLLEVQYLQIRYQVVLPGGGPPRSTAEQCSVFAAVFAV